jgi:hypothetical protein
MKAFESERSRLQYVTAAAVVFAGLLMLMLTVVPVANNDVWILMRIGQMIVDTGKIPDTVLFAFTTVRDNHFNAHEWLVSVLYHEIDRAVGLYNLMYVVGAFALVQFTLCVVLARRQSGSLGVALLLAMLAMACANIRYVLRPELFALLFLVLLLMVFDRYRGGRRWTTLLWALPVQILWANCHGSFLVGPAVAGIFALGEGLTTARAAAGSVPHRLRQGWSAGLPYAVAMLAMIAACAVNPAGVSLLAFPFQLQHSTVMRQLIKEWLPTFSPQVVTERFFWVFIVLFASACALVARLRRLLGATDVLLFLFFSALALERSRHIVWFGFIALTVCARLLGQRPLTPRRELRLRGASIAMALAGLAACAAFGNVGGARVWYAPSNNYNAGLVAELADPAMKGNVLNSYELGGELIYRDWPRLKPSIDSRVDSYGDDYLLFHVRLMQDEKLLNLFLEGNHVDYMLLLRRDFDMSVRDMPSIKANWHIRLTDQDIFLLERNVPLPQPVNPT